MNSTYVRGGIVALALAASVSACNQATNSSCRRRRVAGGEDRRSGGPLQARNLRARGQTLHGPGASRHAGRRYRAGQRRVREWQRLGSQSCVPPADMKELIANYDAGWKDRLAAIARDVSDAKARAGVRLCARLAEGAPAGAAVADPERRRQLHRAHRRHRGAAAARRRRRRTSVARR